MVPAPLAGAGNSAAARATATTGAPASARAVAIPRPRPRLAPTTIVVLPDRSLMASSKSWISSGTTSVEEHYSESDFNRVLILRRGGYGGCPSTAAVPVFCGGEAFWQVVSGEFRRRLHRRRRRCGRRDLLDHRRLQEAGGPGDHER